MKKQVEKIVLETEYFILYSDGRMVGKMDSLRELAYEAKDNTDFWKALNDRLEDLVLQNTVYMEDTGNAPEAYIICGTSAPAFFTGMYFQDDDPDCESFTDVECFEAIYLYEPYQLHFWQDMLLKNGEVWFQKL